MKLTLFFTSMFVAGITAVWAGGVLLTLFAAASSVLCLLMAIGGVQNLIQENKISALKQLTEENIKLQKNASRIEPTRVQGGVTHRDR